MILKMNLKTNSSGYLFYHQALFSILKNYQISQNALKIKESEMNAMVEIEKAEK